jgi:hypothetical protein
LTSVYISSNLSNGLNRHARNDLIFYPGVNDTGETCASVHDTVEACIIGVNNARGLKPQAKNYNKPHQCHRHNSSRNITSWPVSLSQQSEKNKIIHQWPKATIRHKLKYPHQSISACIACLVDNSEAQKVPNISINICKHCKYF